MRTGLRKRKMAPLTRVTLRNLRNGTTFDIVVEGRDIEDRLAVLINHDYPEHSIVQVCSGEWNRDAKTTHVRFSNN